MKELVFRYFWIVALVLCVVIPYLKWTVESLFDIIKSFRRTLKSRCDKLSLIIQMTIYVSRATEWWIIVHGYVIIFILFSGGIMSFLYYLDSKF